MHGCYRSGFVFCDTNQRGEKMLTMPYNKLIGAQDVMQRIGISYSTLGRLVKAHVIPAPRKIGGLNRWLEADIEQYISDPASQTTMSSSHDA